MSIVLNQKYHDQDLEKFFDDMQIFSMGYSWGGFESLATPVRTKKTEVFFGEIKYHS